MLNSKIKHQKGFTLIEIVIVMAIAALMILVVFQAVSGAQKAQRDSARKQEAGRIQSMLESYASNNGGLYPAAAQVGVVSGGGALAGYESNANDPLASGATAKYAVVAACPTTVTGSIYDIVYVPNANFRDYTLSVCTESGGAVQLHP